MGQISSKKSPIPSSVLSGTAAPNRSPWLYSFWKFSRPHTIIGTSLSVIGLYLIAVAENSRLSLPDLLTSPSPLLTPLAALVACLCGNIYIVGLNQLEDVEIDRINKPHLPIASGEFSRQQGWAIVSITGLLALALSALQGYFLMATVWVSLLIGTAYSLPPIRLKRFPIWASFCIFTVRGAIVNLGLFLHFQQWPPHVPPTVWTLTLFILVFTFAIAIFKDIPDIEGDRRYHITTFTVQLGQRAVFNLARWVLTSGYLGLIVAGVLIPEINAPFLVITHGLILAALWAASVQVNLQEKAEIAGFYQLIWKFFYLEYLLFPIACLLG